MEAFNAGPAVMDIVDVSKLKRWSQQIQQPTGLTNGFKHANSGTRRYRVSPFPCDRQLNDKMVLWVGDICRLNAHAIVNSTNEALNDPNPQSDKIFSLAGPQLLNEIQQTVKVCKTGDAKITKGYNLPARYVIHTVGPRYNIRYHTAAEGALFSCYRKIMQLVREHGLSSVALCVVNSARRGYPAEDGAHIALRAVRRFLEKFGETIETVVFVVEDANISIYEMLMPLYFPRNCDDEELATYHLPEDLGNVDGEPFVADRQIRILDKPHLPAAVHPAEVEIEESTELLDGSNSMDHIGTSDFAKMMGDVDRTRPIKRSPPIEKDVALEVQGISRYERILRRARTEDLSEVSQIGCLYQCGVDKLGRPVIVLIGKWFKFREINLEKALLYLVYLLYTAAKNDYVIVYFNTLTASDNRPSMGWIREVYSVLEYKHRKNLKALYIVHPTWWTKIMTWGFTTFMAPSIKDKVHNLVGLEYLYAIIDMQQLQIPTFIREYDMSIYGINYYEPTSDAEEL